MPSASTIRNAVASDLPEIQRLLAEASSQRGARVDVPHDAAGDHHLLVLDAPDGRGLAAASLLIIDGARAHLAMLVIDIRYQDTGLEDRMIGVVEALSRAFGALSVDVRLGIAA